jgi:biotin carboxylase
MNVLFLSPGYPSEMPEFVRGLGEVGARVFGVGDQPLGALPGMARRHLTGYLQVPQMQDELDVVRRVRAWVGAQHLDRIESLSEYSVVLAARLREALDVPGLRVAQAIAFRDKEVMKQVLDAAGIRTPRHHRATTAQELYAAAERIGYPLIVKPIDGAGSAHTFRCENREDLDRAAQGTRHVPQVSVEEFIDGEEFTFDTLTCKGEILYHNVAWYRPRPLVARTHEWISPQVIALRDVEAKGLQGGVDMGRKVLKALGFDSGFTHMEWYRKSDGEVVFGEIGGRPPGARQVDQMNYACDFDSFREWARIVCWGTMEARIERKYNVATVFKRAQGQGRIRHIEGLERLRRDFGRSLVWENLLPVGAERRNWLQTLISDGFLIVRHPDLGRTVQMADRIGSELKLFAS